MANVRLTALARPAAVALALAAAPAAADPPAARAAEEAARRQFEDWRLACGPSDCAIRGAVLGAAGAPVLRVAATPERLTFATSLPLFLPDGLVLTLGDAPPRVVPWRTCGPAGCVAEAALDPDLLAGLKREREAEAVLTLVDGVRVRLPVSLLGFTAAWRAMGAVSP